MASNRRAFLSSAVLGASFALVAPQPALAGIDVSGLRSESGGPSSVAEQLRAYDGSASSRVSQIKELSGPSTSAASKRTASPVNTAGGDADSNSTIASFAYRSAPGFNPRLTRAGALGTLYRCEDQVAAPKGSQQRAFTVTFEFPSDWLQLDKFLGGIQYVDQRNGGRLYVLKTKLPAGESLATVPKSFFGTSIFDPTGPIVKSVGLEVDDYKVSTGQILSDCPDNTCATRRRFKIKYTTVTGNGLRVERRALVDAYEMSSNGDIYMLMTSTNAVKFDAKGGSLERETAEAIVNSFRVD